MLVGPTELGIEELALLVRDPVRLQRLARPRRWPEVVRLGLIFARVLLVVAAVVSWKTGVLDPVTAAVMAGVGLVALFAVKVVLVPPRGRKRDVYEENASLAAIGMVVPDPMRPFMDEMRRDVKAAPPPVASGPRPTHCPSCSGRLGEVEPGDDDEAGAWFCHHCGASLAPEQDKAP